MVSMRNLRRSSRLKKPPFSPKMPQRINLTNRCTQATLRRSPRLGNAPFREDSRQYFDELVKTGEISTVEELLETRFFQGVAITCFSEDLQVELPGIIKGSGFLCGCSQCNYKGEVLSAKMFEKHAGAKTKFETDHIFFSNGLNLYEVFQHVRNTPEEEFHAKILKLREDLKLKQLAEEALMGATANRSKRKRTETEFYRSLKQIASVENDTRTRKSPRIKDAVTNKAPKGEEKLKGVHENAIKNKLDSLIGALDFLEPDNQVDVRKRCANEKLEREKLSESLKQSQKSSENSRQFLKCYRRYYPERPLMDVQGLLSTGLLEGFRVTYKKNETRLEAYIRGIEYECGCSSCNYTKVVTAREIERHAREISENPNDNVYLDCGMTLCKLVKELKGIPLYLLSTFLQEKIKCHPNINCFEMWKGSFRRKHSSVQSKSRDEASNSQKFSALKSSTVTDPAKFNTVPGSSGLDAPGPSSLEEGTRVVYKEWPVGPTSRKRSRRIIKFVNRDSNFNVGPSSVMHCFDKPVLKVKFKVRGMESTTASDVTEAATADPGGSKEGLTNEEETSLKGIKAKKRKRDVYLHKRIFEEGGVPDGTVVTYRLQDKVLLTGFKLGCFIKCSCHDSQFTPSQFEAHAGMAQRRQPYRNIYDPDGKTLHALSLELANVPGSSSVLLRSKAKTAKSKPKKEILKSKPETAKSLPKKDLVVSTRGRLKCVLQSQKGVLVRCTTCKERLAALGDEADPKLIIFCNQCDQVYHIGCLEDWESSKMEDVFKGNWFCCTDCTWVHNSLKNVCALGAKPVPAPFFDLLKKPHSTEGNPVNLSWRIFRGGNPEDRVVLLRSLKFMKGAFKPILVENQEMIRQMVFGKQVAGTGLDFRGVHFVMIKLDEEIVSIAVLRVFGKYAAELPLAATSKIFRRKGYFRMLLSLIEELLHLLQVRLLVSPVHAQMQSIWIQKFGFVKASDQTVQMLKEQHGMMVFEDTAVLEREIQAIAE